MARKLSTKARKYRRGNVLVLVAVCLAVILAFVAISIDGGNLLEQRRRSQATADAAALAAAEDLFKKYPTNTGIDVTGTAAAAAKAIAAGNGYNNDGVSSVVTVRTSPQQYTGGPKKNLPIPKGYVEVSVQRNQARYFSGIFGSGAIPVKARAVARGNWEPAFVGIHVLDLHAQAALTATGESFVTVTGASVIVNSDHPEAATSTGGTLTADHFAITGGTSISGGKGAFIGDIHYGTPPQPDPLRHIPEPDKSTMTTQRNNTLHVSNGTKTISPGVFKGGIVVSGQGNLVMQPGVYYMDAGGFSFTGQGSLAAVGVMIFTAPKQSSDVIDISGTGNILLSPPTTGLYKGLSLFQDRESTNTLSVSGGGGMNITGTFYAANAMMKVSGGGDSKVGSQYISRYLTITGNGGMHIDYNPQQAIPRRVLGLVE